jgi:hypothetical protein
MALEGAWSLDIATVYIRSQARAMHGDWKYTDPDPPLICMGHLSEQDQRGAESIRCNLMTMVSECRNLAAALALFDHANGQGNQQLFREWMRLAMRDGAMSIHNFGHALERVGSLIPTVKGYVDLVDMNALKTVRADFKNAFPHAIQLRNSVAHPNVYDNPNKNVPLTKATVGFGVRIMEGAKATIRAMSGRVYQATWNGELVSYELSSHSVKIIHSVAQRSFDVIAPPDRNGVRWFPPA